MRTATRESRAARTRHERRVGARILSFRETAARGRRAETRSAGEHRHRACSEYKRKHIDRRVVAASTRRRRCGSTFASEPKSISRITTRHCEGLEHPGVICAAGGQYALTTSLNIRLERQYSLYWQCMESTRVYMSGMLNPEAPSILAFEKSISGCASMNFLSASCLVCSSDVGKPSCFCR